MTNSNARAAGPRKPTGSCAARMREIFTVYMDGQGINEVMASTGASRGSVSGHLNEVAEAIGCPVVRGRTAGPKTDALQAERERGQRRA